MNFRKQKVSWFESDTTLDLHCAWQGTRALQVNLFERKKIIAGEAWWRDVKAYQCIWSILCIIMGGGTVQPWLWLSLLIEHFFPPSLKRVDKVWGSVTGRYQGVRVLKRNDHFCRTKVMLQSKVRGLYKNPQLSIFASGLPSLSLILTIRKIGVH